MLMHTREGTTIETQKEKLKTKPDNSNISKALLCSILSAQGAHTICVAD